MRLELGLWRHTCGLRAERSIAHRYLRPEQDLGRADAPSLQPYQPARGSSAHQPQRGRRVPAMSRTRRLRRELLAHAPERGRLVETGAILEVRAPQHVAELGIARQALVVGELVWLTPGSTSVAARACRNTCRASCKRRHNVASVQPTISATCLPGSPSISYSTKAWRSFSESRSRAAEMRRCADGSQKLTDETSDSRGTKASTRSRVRATR